MTTDTRFLHYVIEQLGLGSRLVHKRLFGEYALYVDGKVVAFACDNRLYLKPTPAAQQLAPGLPEQPPYPGAKGHPVADELLDDSERLRALLLATADCLPAPKPKPKKAASRIRHPG